MKKLLPNLILALVFIAGLALLLYPTVSNYINTRHQSHVVTGYEKDMAENQDVDYTQTRASAEEFNRMLAADTDRFLITDEDADLYNLQLNPFGNGIMGYIEIDRIDVKLAIYHGTDDAILQVGAGHVEGTSLPTGGEGTHCAISGHSGLPSALLFTNLDRLTTGDTFTLHILNDVLTYRVDQILVVEPSDLTALEIVPDKDYCTLVTCTPYGINSHRLMVRGERIDNVPPTQQQEQKTVELAPEENAYTLELALLVIITLLILFVLILMLEKKLRRKNNASKRDN